MSNLDELIANADDSPSTPVSGWVINLRTRQRLKVLDFNRTHVRLWAAYSVTFKVPLKTFWERYIPAHYE